MFQRTCSLAVAVLVPLTAACTTLQTRDYTPGNIPVPDAEHQIVAVTQSSGERIDFDREVQGRPAPRAFVDDEAVIGPVRGQSVRVSLSDARSVSVEEKRVQVGRTSLLVLGISVVTLYTIAFLSFSVSF